jgi:hypothetical protein
MNRVDEFPSAELVDRFLCYDPVMAFVADRIMDWMLWRMKQGRVFKRLASSDVFSVELQAAHDVAMARMYARWKKQPDAKGEGDGIRMAHDGTWGRGRG